MFAAPFNCSRRQFLDGLGGGFGAVALGALAAGQHRGVAAPALVDPLQPFRSQVPPLPARAKSVIFLFMVGGPSQVDTFDYKPELQRLSGQPVPASLRKAVEATRFANVFHGCKDELMGSPFRWSQHGKSGMWVSERTSPNGWTSSAFFIRCRPIPTITPRRVTSCTPGTSDPARRAWDRGSPTASGRRTRICRAT
jgi:hypothetical protein